MIEINSFEEDVIEVALELTKLEILTGEEVLLKFEDQNFLNEWDRLYASCPWATVYQSKEFVSVWYNLYYKKYLPIVVKRTHNAKLTGLLTLAQNEKGIFAGAGLDQAEYHVWLAPAEDKGEFIKNALFEIQKHFSKSNVQFKYVPCGTPVEWVDGDRFWKRRCTLRVYPQPVMIIDNNAINTELRKKNKKISINRLKRLGDLRFERIVDDAVFCSVLDQLIDQFDFRKAAMYNTIPFEQDPLKKRFLIALFAQNILHATVLKVNEEIIASNVSAIGKNTIHLQGINTHAPSYAKHSPGILHFLFLGKLLAEEGFEIFDLTPGGNSFKEALATKHVNAYELKVFHNRRPYIKEFKERLLYGITKNKKSILTVLAKSGISPKDIKTFFRRIGYLKEGVRREEKLNFTLIFKGSVNKTRTIRQRVFKIDVLPSQNNIPIKKNNLRDLLSYHSNNGLPKAEFLSESMAKLERGEVVYTFAEKQCLLNSIWVKQVGKANTGLSEKQKVLPEGALVLHRFYSHPGARDGVKKFLKSVVNDLSVNNKSIGAYLIVDARDEFLNELLKGAPFLQEYK